MAAHARFRPWMPATPLSEVLRFTAFVAAMTAASVAQAADDDRALADKYAPVEAPPSAALAPHS
jgi:hypothetical protein